MVETWNWRTAARCQVDDADGLFVRGRHQQEARRFCMVCPVRTECLAHALDNRVERGVWGGMTERQRRALLRERPRVRSWAELLCAARRAYYGDLAARREAPAGADGGAGGGRAPRLGTGRERAGAQRRGREHADPARDGVDPAASPPAETGGPADVTPDGECAGGADRPRRRCNGGGRARRADGGGGTASRGGCARRR